MIDKGRRGLFKALNPLSETNKDEIFIRPPYNSDISLFYSECPKCEEKFCIASCDEEIIKVDQNGIVYLDFSKRGCTFCEECAKVCPKDVLSLEKGDEKIEAVADINVISCMAWHKSICYSCKDVCIDDAIIFSGLFNPEVDINKCTGCGFCYGICPTNAIIIKSTNESEA